jgi:hypothetical protein
MVEDVIFYKNGKFRFGKWRVIDCLLFSCCCSSTFVVGSAIKMTMWNDAPIDVKTIAYQINPFEHTWGSNYESFQLPCELLLLFFDVAGFEQFFVEDVSNPPTTETETTSSSTQDTPSTATTTATTTTTTPSTTTTTTTTMSSSTKQSTKATLTLPTTTPDLVATLSTMTTISTQSSSPLSASPSSPSSTTTNFNPTTSNDESTTNAAVDNNGMSGATTTYGITAHQLLSQYFPSKQRFSDYWCAIVHHLRCRNHNPNRRASTISCEIERRLSIVIAIVTKRHSTRLAKLWHHSASRHCLWRNEFQRFGIKKATQPPPKHIDHV